MSLEELLNDLPAPTEETWNDDSKLDSSDGAETPENALNGQQSTVKTLFEGPKRCDCCINWVEEPQDDLVSAIEEKAESKRHALLIRMKKSHDQERKSLVLDSIVVQSPRLKDLLSYVFEDYEDITTSLHRLVFKSPFKPFFHEWARLEQAVRQQDELISKEHARLLKRILKAELKDTLALSRDYARNGVISFEHLWTIFKSGIDVYSSDEGHDSIYRLVNASYDLKGRFFRLEVREIDFYGSQFGYQSSFLAICRFEGTKAVQSLDVFPAELHPSSHELHAALSKRGEMFRELQAHGHRYREYDGLVELAERDETLRHPRPTPGLAGLSKKDKRKVRCSPPCHKQELIQY